MSYKRLTEKKIDLDKLSEKAKQKISDTYLEYAKMNNALYDLETKIENGTLIELPCKVGETLYVINGNEEIEEAILDNYEINKLGYVLEVINANDKKQKDKYYLFDFDFNKDWFLSKTEAEKKLEELIGGAK